MFSLIGWGGVTTFNSLNNYILKGDAAQGLELLFDSLMVPAADEPDAVYGLVAESAEVADDGKSVTFHLRPEARFAEGRRSPPTTWCSRSIRSRPKATRSTIRPCKTWSRPRRSTRKRCATVSPAIWCATCR